MADLSCEEVVELVTDFLDGALDEETHDRFVQHVASCPGCETYLDQVRRTVSLLGQVPVETLSEETQAGLLAAFRRFTR